MGWADQQICLYKYVCFPFQNKGYWTMFNYIAVYTLFSTLMAKMEDNPNNKALEDTLNTII